MKLSNFHYELSERLIAQEPVSSRDQSRLLVLHRATGHLEHGSLILLTIFAKV